MKYDFFNNQKITGTLSNGEPFNGWVAPRPLPSSHLTEQVAVNDKGQWIPLNEMTNIKTIGINLREETTEVIRSFVAELDPEKIKKINDTDKQALYNVAIKRAGEDGEKNEEEIKKIVDESLMVNELENSTDSDSAIVQKYMKEGRRSKRVRQREAHIIGEPNAQVDFSTEDDYFEGNTDTYSEDEGYNTNADIESEYDPPTETWMIDELINMMQTTADRDELVDYVVANGFGEDQAQELVDKAFAMQDQELVDAVQNDTAEELFSEFLDEFDSEDDPDNIDIMYEALCSHFNLQKEGNQVLRETDGNHYEAILKLAKIYDHALPKS